MKENLFDINKLLSRALEFWYLFPLCVLITGVLAFFYLKTEEPVYRTSALLLIKDNENSNQLDEEAIFADLGLGRTNRNLENEILALKSTPLMYKVAEKLQLQYRYSRSDKFRDYHLYKTSPVKVLNWEPKPESQYLDAVLQAKGNGKYELTVDEQVFTSEFGKELRLPYGKLTITSNSNVEIDSPINISIMPLQATAEMLSWSVGIAKVGESSILELSIEDVSPERARDVLRELIKAYNNSSVEEKNHVFENTIDLVNERIDMLANELSLAESRVENYKQRYSVMELSAEGDMIMDEMSAYSEKISESEVQLQILNSIEQFLLENQNKFEFVPSNAGISNLTLVRQLENFNELMRKRDQERNDLGPAHPDLKLTERQIQNLRQTIIENIQSIKNDFQITLDANRKVLEGAKARMQSLPQRERELLEMERKKTLKEDLYLYLLQKREESAISMAVTVPSGKLIEPAKVPSIPVSPNSKIIWLSAIFMGLALPSGFVFLSEFLNQKVQYEDDISNYTAVPVLGAIGLKRTDSQLVIKKNSRTPIAEMFRLLRTNFSCIAPGSDQKVVLFTSSMSGEGKSFLTLNFGMTQALANKKVVILELDLRRPKQAIYSQLESSTTGVVDYLIDPSMLPKQIIRKSGLHPKLDLINSGLTPPNPSELILSARLRELIDDLRGRYDLILIDAPPVGMVADALQLKDLAQISLYVVRIGMTRKDHFQIIEDIAQNDKLPRPFILLNAIPIKGRTGFSSRYGYGYGYDYSNGKNGYYEKEKPSLLARLNTTLFSKILP
ncbi:MAG: hypothetical protein GVY26_09810 [Bacteroidetes bacterium]|jgi:capsular exopolysaccharide synthesis family protein|nr:hypothetical protein [Bacteroidota bacterium]